MGLEEIEVDDFQLSTVRYTGSKHGDSACTAELAEPAPPVGIRPARGG